MKHFKGRGKSYKSLGTSELNYTVSMPEWQVNYDKWKSTNIHALSGIRTHGLSVQENMAYAS
jgi:hypothetical protein